MSKIQIIAQIINGLGTCFNMFGINLKKKSNVLICLTLGNLCLAIASGMLNAISGMITQIIFVIETIINYFYEKKNGEGVKYPLWMICIYAILPTSISVLFYTSPWDFLPMIGGVSFAFALISKEFLLRFFNLISVAIWIPYNWIFGQYVGTISCIIFTIVNLIAIIRLDFLKRKNK